MGSGASGGLRRCTESFPSFYEGFTVGEQIGQGSFGTVFTAIEKCSQNEIAVKLQLARSCGEKSLTYEASLWEACSHPNVVKLILLCQEADVFFFVMERCAGSFREIKLMKKPKWTVQELRVDMAQMLEGLRYLHDRRFVHRDIKADNVLFGGADGRLLKLADFGLARYLAYGQVLKSVCGTASYMAPEMLAAEGYDAKADVWSLGVLFYLTITGESPCGRPGMPKDSMKKAILAVQHQPEKLQLLSERVLQELNEYRDRYSQKLKSEKSEATSQGKALSNSNITDLPAAIHEVKLAFMITRAEAIGLVSGLLQRQPSSRLSAQSALKNRFFDHGIFQADAIETEVRTKLLINRPPYKPREKVQKGPGDDQPQNVSQQNDEGANVKMQAAQHVEESCESLLANEDASSKAAVKQSSGSTSKGLLNQPSQGSLQPSRGVSSASDHNQSSGRVSALAFGNSAGSSRRLESSSKRPSVRSLVSDMPREEALDQLHRWNQEMQLQEQRLLARDMGLP